VLHINPNDQEFKDYKALLIDLKKKENFKIKDAEPMPI
jgi:hypothetical protein